MENLQNPEKQISAKLVTFYILLHVRIHFYHSKPFGLISYVQLSGFVIARIRVGYGF